MCEALVDVARGQGFGLLHADVLFEDVFVLGVLARYGRLQVELEYGDYSVAIHLDDRLLADAVDPAFSDPPRSVSPTERDASLPEPPSKRADPNRVCVPRALS
jgi:hypothetical protein